MSTPVPRWEWRTFGSRFGAADDAVGAMAQGEATESEEQYFLSRSAEGANVKVRDELMDVKVLREVDERGLERWEPTIKEAFPLSADVVRRVWVALDVSGSPSMGDATSLQGLLEELASAGDEIRTVTIHKRRRRFSVDGCTGELTDVTADAGSIQTVAIESEDAEAVVRAVDRLGLGAYVNTSYPRGLLALLDDEPPRFAVIDVGTNSVKFHIGERGGAGTWRSVVDRAEMTRLGEGMERSGEISAEAAGRTAETIAEMVDEARRHGVRAIVAAGTAGMRNARNRDSVVETIRRRSGVTVEVISGEDEGRLAYVAVRNGLGAVEGSLVVFDTGGGSSQFTFGRGSEVRERFSVEVGAVRYTERFGLDREVKREVLEEALAVIATDLSKLDGRPPPDGLVGMGGAITNMTAVMLELSTYDADRVQGAALERAEVDRQIERYRSREAEARRAIPGLQPKRAEVILAGACIVRIVMEKLGQDSLTVSDRGVRHGLLADRFG
ncbi:MAG TPA: Ppx/GppA family phosphatase [Actinomycetota bacterium]|nr:Ppx/GppA family phosphatase [Actinomycetota bacterium]